MAFFLYIVVLESGEKNYFSRTRLNSNYLLLWFFETNLFHTKKIGLFDPLSSNKFLSLWDNVRGFFHSLIKKPKFELIFYSMIILFFTKKHRKKAILTQIAENNSDNLDEEVKRGNRRNTFKTISYGLGLRIFGSIGFSFFINIFIFALLSI